MKLLVEYKKELFTILALLVLGLGGIYLPIVASVLAGVGLLFTLVMLGYGVFEGYEGIQNSTVDISKRDYLETSKEYFFFKIYLGDLFMLIGNVILIICSLLIGAVVAYCIFLISFDSVKTPLAVMAWVLIVFLSVLFSTESKKN